METKTIILKDASGGMNNHDNPANIAPNELSLYENIIGDEGGWPGKKRKGKELIQYAPIDSKVFDVDAATRHLWHLDEATQGNWLNSADGAHRLFGTANIVTGLFGNGIRLKPTTSRADVGDFVTGLNMGEILDDFSALRYEVWLNIDADSSGRPVLILSNPNEPDPSKWVYVPITNNAVIMGSVKGTPGGQNNDYIKNALSIKRDWDAMNQKDASDPYFEFQIFTKGIPGTKTVIRSGAVPTGRWISVCAQYDSATQKIQLKVNGTPTDGIVNGGGVIDDTDTIDFYVGFSLVDVQSGFEAKNTFKGIIDEIRISDTWSDDVPYKNPRGIPIPFQKSDGTAQCIVSAGTGLYYTVGDGNWTLMQDGFSDVAYWDGKQIGDVLYLSNGVDDPKTWDGNTIREWGEGKSLLTLIAVPTMGGIEAGEYHYFYTKMFGDEETGPSVPTSITLAADSEVIVADIPIGTSACTARRIYRTKKNPASDDVPYLVREIADNTTTTMDGPFTAGSPAGPTIDTGRDGLLDATLGTDDYSQMTALVFTTSLGKPKYLLPAFNRMMMAGFDDKPYTAEFTQLFAIEVRPVANFIRAESDKGPIVALGLYYGEIHASKSGSATLVLRGDNPDNWQQFETLHPTIGCIDHWGFVHRTIPGQQGATDSYSLCFPGKDGIYEYIGSEFRKISNKISPVIDGLSQNNATRLEFNTTTEVQFRGAKTVGGGATQNIQEENYDTDGLRQTPGQVKIVDQLNYLGLGNSYALGGLKLIALCKGVDEGEFFFAVDGDSKLYRTIDNFSTSAAILDLQSSADTPAANGNYHHIIEIVRNGLFYYLFTDTDAGELVKTSLTASATPGTNKILSVGSVAGLSVNDQIDFYSAGKGTLLQTGVLITAIAGSTITVDNLTIALASGVEIYLSRASTSGMIFRWDQNALVASEIYTTADTLFYESDTLTRHNWENSAVASAAVNFDTFLSGPLAFSASKVAFGKGRLGFFNAGLNTSLNHRQKVKINTGSASITYGQILKAPSQTATANALEGPRIQGGNYSDDFINPGFYAFRDNLDYTLTSQKFYIFASTSGINMEFTHRELAQWQGGTVRPQAFINTAGDTIYFIAAGPEDANGNRTTHFYRLNPVTGVLTAMYLAISSMALTYVTAFGAFSPTAYLISTVADTTNAFTHNVRTFNLTSNTQTASFNSAALKASLPIKAVYRESNSDVVFSGKYFESLTSKDNYNFKGFIGRFVPAGVGSIALIKNLDTLGPVAPFPLELAIQTMAPSAIYAGMQNIGTEGAICSINAANAFVTYRNAYDASTKGLFSNLIFVPSSDIAGGNLWADRLYFSATRDLDGDGFIDDAKPLQLGVPGAWKVIGEFTGEFKNLGIFTAFDNFQTDYDGAVKFFFANGSTGPFLPADFIPITPNQKITISGTTPQPIIQWKLVLTWESTVLDSSRSPTVDFVNIGYFLGNATLPRVIGWNWESRSYWAVAENGFSQNNLVLVYQHNNSWTTYRAWRIKGAAIFRNQLVALEDYQFIRLEVGNTDLGNLIVGKARQMILAGNTDKTIRRVYINVMSYVNKDFPSKAGWIKLTSFAAGVALENIWSLAIPAASSVQQRQVDGIPTPKKNFGWARALEIEVKTSEDSSGDYMAFVAQPEQITGMILEIMESGPRRRSVYP